MAQQYKIINFITGMPEYFDLEVDAINRISALESEIMVKHAGRFSIAQLIDVNSSEQWESVTNESPENGTYVVYIGATATYERFTSKTEALAKNQALKDEFLATLKQTPVLATAPVQPSTTGTQTL